MDRHIKWLQLVQNTAASFVSAAKQCDHILTILHSLHWLPMHQQAIFKTDVTMWRCVHHTVPAFIQEICIPVKNSAWHPRLQFVTTRYIQLPKCLIPCKRLVYCELRQLRDICLQEALCLDTDAPLMVIAMIGRQGTKKQQRERKLYNAIVR